MQENPLNIFRNWRPLDSNQDTNKQWKLFRWLLNWITRNSRVAWGFSIPVARAFNTSIIIRVENLGTHPRVTKAKETPTLKTKRASLSLYAPTGGVATSEVWTGAEEMPTPSSWKYCNFPLYIYLLINSWRQKQIGKVFVAVWSPVFCNLKSECWWFKTNSDLHHPSIASLSSTYSIQIYVSSLTTFVSRNYIILYPN